MKSLTRMMFVALLLLVLPASSVAEEKYMLGYAGFAGFQVPMWAVQDLGLLQKYGLDGETVLVVTSNGIARFAPHITLARINRAAGPLEPWLATHRNLASPPWQASEFRLYESTLGRDGPHYEPVARYALG